MGEAMKETFPKDPKAPARQEYEGSWAPPEEPVHVVCMGRECSKGSGQFQSIHRFNGDDADKNAIEFARNHHERTGHEVLVPFRLYERKLKG